jgi:hypothetical protein
VDTFEFVPKFSDVSECTKDRERTRDIEHM